MKRAIIFFLTLFIFQCASPVKSLEKGKYNRAYKSSLRALEKGKSPVKNQKILIEALNEIIANETIIIDRLQASTDLIDNEEAIKANQDLQVKIVMTNPYLNDEFDSALETLVQKEKQGLNSLANYYFSSGKKLLKKAEANQNKKLYQEAYYEFEKANGFGSSETDLKKLTEKCFESGKIIYDIQVSYNDVGSGIYLGLPGYGKKHYTFEKFHVIHYNTKLTEEEKEKVDCQININFGFLETKIDEENEQLDFKDDVVTGTQTITNANGEEEEVDIVEELEGSVNIQKLTKTATQDVSIEVTSNSNSCYTESTYFYDNLTSTAEIISIEGDLRVIPDEYKDVENGELSSDDLMSENLLESFSPLIENHLFKN